MYPEMQNLPHQDKKMQFTAFYTITKEKTTLFLKDLAKGHEVYAPVRRQKEDVVLELLSPEKEITFDYIRLPIGAKSVLYPQTDPMIAYNKGKLTSLNAPLAARVIFGLKSCDVSAIRYTDRFFTKNFEDVYYTSRRDKLAILSVACNAPDVNCFCTSTKTGPYLQEGFDLQFTDKGDGFFVEVGSPLGESILSHFSSYFTKGSDAGLAAKQKIHDEAIAKFPVQVNMEKAVEILKTDKIKPEFWQKWADQCICCGGCSYTCCTCTCFNVVDRGSETEGVRYRCWDSCQFSGYTREASQHNPRPKDQHRLQRWFEHKLKYDVITNGTYSCMGCGRCASVCPGFIGMIHVVADICAKGEMK